MNKIKIVSNPKFSFKELLCDPVTLGIWSKYKLPNDSFSIDNAIIITKSLKWTICIDP